MQQEKWQLILQWQNLLVQEIHYLAFCNKRPRYDISEEMMGRKGSILSTVSPHVKSGKLYDTIIQSKISYWKQDSKVSQREVKMFSATCPLFQWWDFLFPTSISFNQERISLKSWRFMLFFKASSNEQNLNLLSALETAFFAFSFFSVTTLILSVAIGPYLVTHLAWMLLW